MQPTQTSSTYATAVRGNANGTKRTTELKKPQGKSQQTLKAMDQFSQEYRECERRTFILRRAPFGTTTDHIYLAINEAFVNEFNITDHPGYYEYGAFAPESIIFGIQRDPVDKRRWYISFRKYEHLKALRKKGFSVNGMDIRPQNYDVHGFIPNPPYYVGEKAMKHILSEYGRLIKGQFTTYKDEGHIRTGGYYFEIDLHKAQMIPKEVEIDGHVCTVVDYDGIRQCSFCDKVGHLRRDCRSRKHELEQKAYHELAEMEWENDEDGNATDRVDTPEQETPENEETEEEKIAKQREQDLKQQIEEDRKLREGEEKTRQEEENRKLLEEEKAREEAEEQRNREEQDRKRKQEEEQAAKAAEENEIKMKEAEKRALETRGKDENTQKKAKVTEPKYEDIKRAKEEISFPDGIECREKLYVIHGEKPFPDKPIVQGWTKKNKNPIIKIPTNMLDKRGVDSFERVIRGHNDHLKVFQIALHIAKTEEDIIVTSTNHFKAPDIRSIQQIMFLKMIDAVTRPEMTIQKWQS